jgi:hypothetical protein
MRFFTALLAIYVLVLTAVPCCAFDGCDIVKKELTEKHTPSNDTDDDCGSCSPFFCHSCSGFVVSTFQFVPNHTPTSYQKQFSLFIIGFTPQYIPLLWQPPDLA